MKIDLKTLTSYNLEAVARAIIGTNTVLEFKNANREHVNLITDLGLCVSYPTDRGKNLI